MKTNLGINANRITDIIGILSTLYPNAVTELEHKNSFQLLLALILSAQCTDRKVNKVTKRLFKKYKTPEDFAALTPKELAPDIKYCGLHRNKSKYIVETARKLVSEHNSEVPDSRDSLEKLPGVGRKSAGVLLNEAFNQNFIPVDTHVFRVAHRLGLAKSKTPFATEKELMEVIPEPYWRNMHQYLVRHGRRVCKARAPLCGDCLLEAYCPKIGYPDRSSGKD